MSDKRSRIVTVLIAIMLLLAIVSIIMDASQRSYIKGVCRMNGYYDAEWGGGAKWNGKWYCVELHPFPEEATR